MPNPLCRCSTEAETAYPTIFCFAISTNMSALTNDLNEVDSSFSTLKSLSICFCITNDKFDGKKNCNILMFIIKFDQGS